MVQLIATFTAFVLVMLGMSVGVIFVGRSIKGSCGGISCGVDKGEISGCEFCPSPEEEKKTCERRKQRAKEKSLKVLGS